MLKNLKNRLNESKGFSLVELIVVIAIMVILIALLVPNVVGYISKAQDSANLSAAKSVYNAMNTAVIDYKAQNGSYPSPTDLVTALNNASTTEKLVTVPKGTAVAVGYADGDVWAVAASSSAGAVSAGKNIQMYSPYGSGNIYDPSGAANSLDASGFTQTIPGDITYDGNATAWAGSGTGTSCPF